MTTFERFLAETGPLLEEMAKAGGELSPQMRQALEFARSSPEALAAVMTVASYACALDPTLFWAVAIALKSGGEVSVIGKEVQA